MKQEHCSNVIKMMERDISRLLKHKYWNKNPKCVTDYRRVLELQIEFKSGLIRSKERAKELITLLKN